MNEQVYLIPIENLDKLEAFANANKKLQPGMKFIIDSIKSNSNYSYKEVVTDFEDVQSVLNKNFHNIRMGADHTLFLNKIFKVLKKQ